MEPSVWIQISIVNLKTCLSFHTISFWFNKLQQSLSFRSVRVTVLKERKPIFIDVFKQYCRTRSFVMD